MIHEAHIPDPLPLFAARNRRAQPSARGHPLSEGGASAPPAVADRRPLTADRFAVSPTDPRIDAMLRYLRGRGWVKRDQVFAALGVGDRVGRALKAQCGGLIISDSQQGYKHILDATPGEFHHAANEIRSRVRELQSYLLAMERVYHREGQTEKL